MISNLKLLEELKMQYTENESYFCPDLNKEVVVTLEVIEHRTSQTKDGRIDQRKKLC